MGAQVTRLARRYLLREKTTGPHECEATRRAAALAQEMRSMATEGRVYVKITHVMEAIDPGGLRSLPQLPPGADPLTGCLPVTAAEHSSDGPG